jgi:sugar phosphate isomerase/epimerase
MEAYLGRHPGAARSGDPAYRVLVERALRKLRDRMEPYWMRTQDCIASVLDYAADKNIALGLENREAFTELPLDADFPALLASMPAPSPAGYWHDCGHGQLKENMGLINHRAQLEANAARQLGFHLHDVDAAGNDHQPLGSGTVDFGMVSSFWRPGHLLVIELSPRATIEGVLQSRALVDKLLSSAGLAG